MGVAALVCVGLVRRADAWERATQDARRAYDELLMSSSITIGDKDDPFSLKREIEKLRRATDTASLPTLAPDGTIALSSLLRVWPTSIDAEPKSIAVRPDGITLTAGHDNQAYGNRVVSTGRLRNGHWVAPAYSGGLTVADYYGMGPGVFYNNSAHDNIVGFVLQRVSPTDPLVYVPPPIRSDYLFTHSGCAGADAALCFNNHSLPDPITFETEDNEAVLWRQKLAAQRVRVGPSLSADCLFDWAQQRYADLLPPAGAVTRVWSTYLYRHYPQTGTYVGVDTRDDHVYYLGPTTAGQLMDLGAAADWLRTASCR